MTTLITRLLADAGTASEASTALQSNGFAEDSVGVISGSEADARAAMAEMGVSDEAASAYASGIAGGNALVSVRAPFGKAGSAITALKKFDAIDVGLENEDVHIEAKDDPQYATDSIIRGNRKFLTGDGALESGRHFMSFGGLLSKSQRGKAKVDTSTISAKFGMKLIKQPKSKKNLLTNNPTPFSSLFGMKLIKESRDRRKPLVDNPTPFSSALGLPVLTDRQ